MRRVRVEAAFLATTAETHDGLLFVMGGYPDWWTVPQLPATERMSCVYVLGLDSSEKGTAFGFSLVLDGEHIANVHTVFGQNREVVPGAPIRQIVTFTFQCTFRSTGRQEFSLVEDKRRVIGGGTEPDDGETVAVIPLAVRLTPEP